MSFPPFVVYTQISQWINCNYTINICKKQVKSHFTCFLRFYYILLYVISDRLFQHVFQCRLRLCNCIGIPAGFFPPACAIFGRPPPPLPTFPAIALIRLPACAPASSLHRLPWQSGLPFRHNRMRSLRHPHRSCPSAGHRDHADHSYPHRIRWLPEASHL